MAGLGRKEKVLPGPGGAIRVKRNKYGVPCIRADNFTDMYFGLGWVHAADRLLAMELTRLVARGAAAEYLGASLLRVDISMRRYNLWGDALSQAGRLSGEACELVEAYCAGINHHLNSTGLPFEFKLIGYRPRPWTAADCLMMSKMIGIVDLTETQGWMEKFILQMIRQGVPLAQIKELFPYLTDEPDDAYLELLRRVKLVEPMIPETLPWAFIPRLQCSNNWAVSSGKTISGRAILCGDPHLDISRLPAIWQEVSMRAGDYFFMGATIPGTPGPALGRTGDIAWSPTYGNMDVIDYFIEDVRDGNYRKGDRWLPFHVREETFGVKKGSPVKVCYYENEHGVLERDPRQQALEDGYYLCFAWSAARGCGAETAENMLAASRCVNVKEAMACFAGLDFAAFNWVIADKEGNIGYQMSGRAPVRNPGCSGLLPLPGWEERYDWRGYHDRIQNPSLYNPPEQFIVTANQDLNRYGRVPATNLAMAPYRAERITGLLAARDDHSVESMKQMHYDLYSKQAEQFMPLIRPFLPDSENGRLLREWDLNYTSASRAATLFENIYREMVRIVFGELNFGPAVLDYLLEDTLLFQDYYWNYDQVLLNGDSAWYKGQNQQEVIARAVDQGLKDAPEPYGAERKIMMKHLLFGGRLPKFTGYDYGPLELPGGRATISISQIFKAAGREATFSPAYRFITDFAEDAVHSTMAGGPSDRRFSRWYTSGIKDWLAGRYRVNRP